MPKCPKTSRNTINADKYIENFKRNKNKQIETNEEKMNSKRNSTATTFRRLITNKFT